MQVALAYQGRSQLTGNRLAQALRFAPNLAREAVAFDAALLKPLRFREAISALHDVVIGDLRYQPRDKAAYEAWKQAEKRRLAAVRGEALKQAKAEILARHADVPPDLEQRYERSRRRYWNARQEYSNYLRKNDPDLWRKLMPCDPVVTVADDVVFFECFSADESSYGCLTVDRDGGFGRSENLQLGTTNVDYSWDLFHHFQALRSYRETRLRVDPQGIEVATGGEPEYREEKIDLPPGWLRGFLQIQVAMGLPMRRVRLSREAVYGVLAWHKRHRARKSPRALRFELTPGQSQRLVIEPWEEPIVSHATTYDGPPGEPIRIWGVRRLLALARVLPLAESFDVYLLGTGLPSFWVARMGEMRLTLGLSGWTANDWTRGAALDLLLPETQPAAGLVQRCGEFLQRKRAATFDEVRSACLGDPSTIATALNQLARTGQVIHDLAAGVYRWRQVMPQAVGEADIGPENAELVASRKIVARGEIQIVSRNEADSGFRSYVGKVGGKPVELVLDADGIIKHGKCDCSHHFQSGIRQGPCRHLLAMRQVATQGAVATSTKNDWYEALRRWANN